MANRDRGEVAVEIGGASYTLAFTTAARRAIKAATGKDSRELLERLERDPTDPDIAGPFVFGLTRRGHADLTAEQIDALLDDMTPRELAPVMAAVFEAVVLGVRGTEPLPADPPSAGNEATTSDGSSTS